MTSRGLFVTGTDTNVGKTVVTAALAGCLRRWGVSVAAMKPVETGVSSSYGANDGSDAARLRQAAQMEETIERISPYRLSAPLAPASAARAAEVVIHVDTILCLYGDLATRYNVVLVEGSGGVRVPLTEQLDMRDLIVQLGIPALVVGRTSLGGINHAVLTVEALQQVGIPIVGLLLNSSVEMEPGSIEDQQSQSTVTLLRERGLCPVLGPIGHIPRLVTDWDHGVSQLCHHPAIETLVSRLRST